MTVTEFLHTRVPFLSGLTEAQARELAAQAEQKAYARGQTIVFKGVSVDGLHVVASGAAAVWVKPAGAGAAPVQAARLEAGEVFGEISILEQGMAGATVKAAEDETLVFIIPQEAFRSLLETNAAFKARVEALVQDRKKKTERLLAVR